MLHRGLDRRCRCSLLAAACLSGLLGRMRAVELSRPRGLVARLDLRHAAINKELDTVDEAAVIRCQEDGSLANFVGISDAA